MATGALPHPVNAIEVTAAAERRPAERQRRQKGSAAADSRCRERPLRWRGTTVRVRRPRHHALSLQPQRRRQGRRARVAPAAVLGNKFFLFPFQSTALQCVYFTVTSTVGYCNISISISLDQIVTCGGLATNPVVLSFFCVFNFWFALSVFRLTTMLGLLGDSVPLLRRHVLCLHLSRLRLLGCSFPAPVCPHSFQFCGPLLTKYNNWAGPY